jgi:Tfp pilus assembly PilM family ATPase
MSKSRDILVLQAEAEELRLSRLISAGDQREILDHRAFRASGLSKDASALRDQQAVDALCTYITESNYAGRELVCLVGGSGVACHYFEMPAMPVKAMGQAVRLKLGQQLHFDLSKAEVSVARCKSTSSGAAQARVCAAAVEKELADAAVAIAERCGLQLVAISLVTSALTNIARRVAGDAEGTRAFVHLDERSAQLIVLKDGEPFVINELTMNLSDLTSALMRPILAGEEVIQLDEEKAIRIRNAVGIPTPDVSVEELGVQGDRLLPLLEPTLQKWSKLLTQWLTFASTSIGRGPIRTASLVGPGIEVKGLAALLSTRLSIELKPENWLTGFAALSVNSTTAAPNSIAAVAGAAEFAKLPDLLPVSVRKERKMRRLRRSVSICGPMVAAAVLAFSFLFEQVGSGLEARVDLNRQKLAEMQDLVLRNARHSNRQARVSSMEQAFASFAHATPSWTGVFKEFSLLLPAELRAEEYVAREKNGAVILTLNASVHSGDGGRSFDQVVSQTLLLLQRSAFFKRVELATANKEAKPGEEGTQGTLAIELDLSHPIEKSREGA